MNDLCESLMPVEENESPTDCNFWELLPRTESKPLVLVVDNIDALWAENNVKTLPRIKDLVCTLSMASVAPGFGLNFQVFVLTSQPDIAEELLSINGGRKVRMIAYDDEIVGGNPLVDDDHWKASGLKLKEKDVKDFLEEFIQTEKNVGLAEDTKTMIIQLGVLNGTVGFVRTICRKFKEEIHEERKRQSYLKNLQQQAENYANEWENCKRIRNPVTVIIFPAL